MLKLIKRLSVLTLTCVALACCLTTSARADSLVLDPVGDTFGDGDLQHDITSAGAVFDDAVLTFTVNFAGPVFAPSSLNVRSVTGFIDIDSDRDAATGMESTTSFFAPGPDPDLGVEYGIDLGFEAARPGFVAVYNAVTFRTVGLAPITFSADALSVSVPLALIGGNGYVNYALVVGNFVEATDKLPNGSAPPSSTPVPEPATMLLLGTGLAAGALARRRRRK